MVTNYVSLLTAFEETVGQGIGPNGTSGGTVSTGAEWEAAETAGTAFQVAHIGSSLDLSGVKKTKVTPESVRQRIKQTTPESPALSNTEFPFTSYITGSGTALADGVTATATSQSRMLSHCMGGVSFTATHTAAGGGHTTTVVNVDDATTWSVGDMVAWEDPATLLCHPRVITDITVLAVTLDKALPSAPGDGDLIRGGATIYIDEGVIADTSGTLGSTLSFVCQKAANGSAGHELNGCKATMASISFGRNEFATIEHTVTSARFTSPANGPDPTLPTFTPPTPPVIGPDTQVLIAAASGTSDTTVCNGALSIDPGLPVRAVECMTARTGNMEGYGGYTLDEAPTLVDVDLFPRDVSWFTADDAQTNQNVSLVRLGASGSCYAVSMQNCEVREVADGNGDITSSVLQFRAVEVNADTATTALERSVFRIFIG